MSFSAWLDPLTVKVSSEEIAAVVAVDNTVHVEHWNDLEDEVLSESSCHRIVAQEEVDDVFDKVADLRLSWMHPRSQEDNLFFFGCCSWWASTFPNGDVITVVA